MCGEGRPLALNGCQLSPSNRSSSGTRNPSSETAPQRVFCSLTDRSLVRTGQMRDGELKYPKWEREFQETILEFDQDKLPEKAQRFENAVSVRLQELASDSDHHDEREAIADATTTISVLKKYKFESDSKGKRVY